LTAVKNAKSASDLEDIFEIEHLLYEMAIDYLLCSFDHKNHNFNFINNLMVNGFIYLMILI